MQWYGERSIESLSDFYKDYHRRLGRSIEHIRTIQMIKLATEVGEALQEFEGTHDYNPRKGTYGSDEKVAQELGDVIGTAMVSLFLFCSDPEKVSEDTVEKFHSRVKEYQEKEEKKIK